jgi:hypothetical protein
MIQKFKEFIDESKHPRMTYNSLVEEINTPFMDFADRILNIANHVKDNISETMKKVNDAVEYILETFDDIIVDEPSIDIAYNFKDVEVLFKTNIPGGDEEWEKDESPVLELGDRLSRMFNPKYDKVSVEIHYDTTEEGNAIIRLSADVINEEIFGCEEELVKAIIEMGREK